MAQLTQQLSRSEIVKRTTAAMVKTALYVVLYVVITAVVQWFFTSFLPRYGVDIANYVMYAQTLLAIAFGYLIVSSIATFFYWSMRQKYDHATAASIKNIVKIVGAGAMVAAISGAVAGGAAGVSLGGFMGVVIGFASQQVLGQAIAGLFLLIARPYKIGDAVVLAGEEGIVEDVATLFTVIVKADNTKVLIPNNSIVGGKIHLKPRSKN
ncbi:MAG: mechanosensitive ion channel [Candidatus Nezhaarchaeales archaeon]